MATSNKLRVLVYTKIGSPNTYTQVMIRLAEMPDVEAIKVDHLDEFTAQIPSADILVLGDPREPDDKPIADALHRPDSKVRFIQCTLAGTHQLTKHNLPRSIRIANHGGAAAPAVAEHAMALLIALARRIDAIVVQTPQHKWDRQFAPPIMAMEGRTLVIVGMGHIGRNIAKRAKGWDLKIIGVTRSGNPEPLADETYQMADLHKALSQADFIAITVALSPSTQGLINAAALAACKPGARLVNVSRGETVDQDALIAALESGQIGGAGLDVTYPEPLPEDHPLWDAPNVIISPHCAGGGSLLNGVRTSKLMAENINRFRRGEPLLSEVPIEG